MEGIRAARERAGLNQSELARKLGVTPGAVFLMESEGRYPNAAKLPAIADALDCSIDALFGRIKKDAKAPPQHCVPSRTPAPTIWSEEADT